MAETTGPRGPQGPAGTTFELPLAIANGGTGANTALGAANALMVESLWGKAVIAEGDDLNSIIDVGSYAAQTSAIAASLANCPTDTAFSMVVSRSVGNEAYISQKITRYSNGVVYYRCYYVNNDTWGPWYKFEGVPV